MQQHIHTIVKHFFQKDSLQEVPEQVLQQFTAEHPYSSVGHWLLAKKVHDTAPDRYETVAANAVAWFSNPLWLHWTLQEHEPVAETLLIPSPREEKGTYAASRPVVQEPAPQDPAPVITTAADTKTPEAPAENPVEATAGTEEETEILIPGVSEPVSLIETTPATPAEKPQEETIGEPAATAPAEGPAAETPAPPANEPTSAEKTASPTGEPAAKPIIPPSLASELKDSFKPVISDSEEPVFEPYHTIDYFASQGIKLRQEDLKDKLGMQLKSFTDWLRSMKRIAPVMQDTMPEPMDDTLQQSIQTIAGHSIEGKEIVTEAMAEVWVKQGSKQKAIAIYEKLSLLNPAKSPYFAARIDQIKAM